MKISKFSVNFLRAPFLKYEKNVRNHLVGSPFLSEFFSRTVPYDRGRCDTNRPSIVLKNTAKSTKNATFYQNLWRF
jgi:hypothetical protein